MENNELIEKLAELEHIQWSHWERYRSKKVKELDTENEICVDKLMEQLSNWERLRETEYKHLNEKEKESDREWARRVCLIITQWFWELENKRNISEDTKNITIPLKEWIKYREMLN